ncbi:MAG: hypothetical protein KJ646_02620 [Nanoarchaeota archaeon]|nr:hypothetical protein [Nanoarchaeota archaeon]MBU4116447.1 hypothetical protein [Nanoarchaeota archaeon]
MVINLDKATLGWYMYQCIEIARKTPYQIGRPYVGAIVVSQEGEISGKGYKKFIPHTKRIMHAERVALDNAGYKTKQSYLFTTLEPCICVKKNQVLKSCSELIVERGIDTVIIGMQDLSSAVHSEAGIKFLKNHGINVKRYHGLNNMVIDELISQKWQNSFLNYNQR